MIDFEKIVYALIGVIYYLFHRRIEKHESVLEEHSDKIKGLQDFNTLKVERIEKDIEDLSKEFKDFKKQIETKIHTDSNVINSANATISRVEKVLKFNEDLDDKLDTILKKVGALEKA